MIELTNTTRKLMLSTVLKGLGMTVALAGTSWLIYKWYTAQKTYMKTDWYLDKIFANRDRLLQIHFRLAMTRQEAEEAIMLFGSKED